MVHVIFLTIVSWASPRTPVDSLRLETINGKQYIIHQIDEKETLYAISRRYGVPVTGILESNPKADGGLAVGQLLKVPYLPKAKTLGQLGGTHKVKPSETLFSISKLYAVSVDELKAWNNLKDNSLSLGQELIVKKAPSFEPIKAPELKSMKGTHSITAKETLFSISKMYGITIDQLKEWNHLQDNELKIGQIVFVMRPTYNQAEPATPTVPLAKQETVPLPNTQNAILPPTIKEEVKPSIENPPATIKISEAVAGTDEVKQGGLAELIEGTEGNRKYLALHRTAKSGTILKVRNELNNREVFVRVVGTLPNTGINDNLIIKISKSAYDRLGAIDPKFRVEVTYYK